MRKKFRLIFFLCGLAVLGVVFLQLFWLKNYYIESKQQFLKEINHAFEDALKQEASIRYDSLQHGLYNYVSDTANITISSQWDENCSSYIQTFINRQNSGDRFTFGDGSVNFPVRNDKERLAVAAAYARIYRSENLERQSAFFQTRNIAKYSEKLSQQHGFDTANLRFFFAKELGERSIHQPFVFSNSGNQGKKFSFAATAFQVPGDQISIQAVLPDPSGYLLRKMGWPVAGSFILLFIVGAAIYYLLKTIYRQKKLSEIKNDFISNITHELKTPLATVSAAIEAMDNFNAKGDPARAKKYLDTSKKEINRLSGLVDKILDISIYEQQSFDLKIVPTDIDILIKELIQDYPPAEKVSIIYLNRSADRIIKADRLHLYHALLNLVDNAVKYSNGSTKVNIRFLRHNDYSILEVSDNGIGIEPGNLPYIFDKFYRVPAGNAHKVKGYGLGLFYVKNIMEKHGGWCRVESTPGKGSKFKLGFPYAL